MNYSETLQFLFAQLPAYHRIGKAAYKNNLDNTLAFDEHLGHPHSKFLTIHVAGTNGKGSVSHMAASILRQAGYRTGLYTSPHLIDFRERIKINEKVISQEAVVSFVQKNMDIISDIKPSFFEMTVAMAFDHFAREEADIAVIETGLGGRLDSTNIITPILSVITNIGHDHMDLLGDTLEKIAAEKAGIIKKGVPVVISETHAETNRVFLEKSADFFSVISFADQNFRCTLDDGYAAGERKFILYDKANDKVHNGITPLGGDCQAKNIQAVYQVFRSLEPKINITADIIADGIKNVITNTGLLGRWQILSRNPLTICDTGHNREGLEYVTKQLSRLKRKALRIVLGFVNDKDLGQVLPLFPKDAIYYFTRASVTRALDEKILKLEAGRYRLTGNSYPDVKTAVRKASDDASEEDVIFIGGSTFVVADCLMPIVAPQ